MSTSKTSNHTAEIDKIIWQNIDAHVKEFPQFLVQHHIQSCDQFYKYGIQQFFREKNPMSLHSNFDEKLNLYKTQCHFYFGGRNGDKIYFGKPIIYDANNVHAMYPNEARLRDMTYGMTIHYDIEIEYMDYVDEQPNNPIEPSSDDEVEEEAEAEPPKKKEKSREQRYQNLKGQRPKPIGFVSQPLEEIKMVYLGRFPIMVQSEFCVLHGMPDSLRFSMGECRNDRGGYFIINGKEKVVISQEKFADNIIFVHDMRSKAAKEADDEGDLDEPDTSKIAFSAEVRSVSENISKPKRTMSVQMLSPTASFVNGNIVVNVPNVTLPIPLFILFRALGVLSDKEIIQTCLLDMNKYHVLLEDFRPSIHDAGAIFTQTDAITFISQLLLKNKTTIKTLEILSDYLFPHIGEMNFKDKAYYLGYMVFKLLCLKRGIDTPIDRDSFRYKRVETTGTLMSELFSEVFTLQLHRIHKLFEEQYNVHSKSLYEKNLRKLVADRFEFTFNENRVVEFWFSKAFRGNWGATTQTKRIGVIQDLNRLSFNAAISHLRKTNVPIDSTLKLVGPRLLNNTQWGFMDPIDTPDGSHIGIQKHLSLFTRITPFLSREPMIQWLREKTDMRLLADSPAALVAQLTKVFVNGCWIGLTGHPIETAEKVRNFRRNGLIPITVSATFDGKDNTVYVYTDAGRVIRPVYYTEVSETGDKRRHLSVERRGIDCTNLSWTQLTTGIAEKKTQKPGFYDLDELYDIPVTSQKDFTERNPAVIDYIDASETENTLIALNYNTYKDRGPSRGVPYTHCEIHETLCHGVMFNLIPFPEHNAQQRDIFSCSQSKQAVSLYHTNYLNRMDKNGVVMNSPQIPLVKSRYLKHICNEENVYGQNAVIAIMSYNGYNVEDSILFNEASLKRGLFYTTYYTTYSTFEEKTKMGDHVVEKLFTNVQDDERVVGVKPGMDYSHLDENGIIKEGTPVNDQLVIIGLSTNDLDDPNRRIDESVSCKKGQLGIVDRTFITEGEEGHRIAKVRIREERIPNFGDKFAQREGQKGTVGLIIPERDMPFTKDGVRPDMIMNPHAIPSRMTIGVFLEMVLAKGAVVYGAFGDSTAYNGLTNKPQVYGELLNKIGYHSSGNEIMYNGYTGEQVTAEVFLGPSYYMRLKHMTKDKVNYRARGPNTALTRQPVSGRANDGGLRIGEMERDAVLAHGISAFLNDSMMERADAYQLAICNTTGMVAIYNPAKNLFMSMGADGPLKFTQVDDTLRIKNITRFGRKFSIVAIPYAMKLLIQELHAMNLQMRIITEDNIHLFEPSVKKPTKPAKKLAIEDKPKQKKRGGDSEPKLIDPITTMGGSVADEALHPPDEDDSDDEVDLINPITTHAGGRTGKPSKKKEGAAVAESELKDIIDEVEPDIMKFHEGDLVYIRASPEPERVWVVKTIGNRFLTIETDGEPVGGERVKVVSPHEVFSINDGVYGKVVFQPQHVPTDLGGIPVNLGEMPIGSLANGVGMQHKPDIMVSPVIKIVNGPDNSTGNIETSQPMPNNLHGALGAQQPNTVAAIVQQNAPKKEIDFNKLVIEKVT
jgi:DNA-directed RNA polymerase II subunit RPB2